MLFPVNLQTNLVAPQMEIHDVPLAVNTNRLLASKGDLQFIKRFPGHFLGNSFKLFKCFNASSNNFWNLAFLRWFSFTIKRNEGNIILPWSFKPGRPVLGKIKPDSHLGYAECAQRLLD